MGWETLRDTGRVSEMLVDPLTSLGLCFLLPGLCHVWALIPALLTMVLFLPVAAGEKLAATATLVPLLKAGPG